MPDAEDLTQHFISHDEALNFFGGTEGWIAVMLLVKVAGCLPRETDG